MVNNFSVIEYVIPRNMRKRPNPNMQIPARASNTNSLTAASVYPTSRGLRAHENLPEEQIPISGKMESAVEEPVKKRCIRSVKRALLSS
jgi:hypothetical protein